MWETINLKLTFAVCRKRDCKSLECAYTENTHEGPID